MLTPLGALIDARPVGWGASGRNSGFVIDQPHKFDLDSRDPARLSAILRLNRAAIADLEAAVEQHGIDCEWSRAGKLQGGVKVGGTRKMANVIAALEAIGERLAARRRRRWRRGRRPRRP